MLYPMQEMQWDALKLLGLDGIQSLDPDSQLASFVFKEDCSALTFSPPKSSSNGWSIAASRIPATVRDTLLPHAHAKGVKQSLLSVIIVCPSV